MRSCNQSLTILMSMTHHAFTAQKITFTKARRRPGIVPIRCFFLTGELRQIKGITENIYQRLIPYVCVLPTTELSINLNMLTENDIPIFRALFLNNITDADARVLLQKAEGRLANHGCISLLGAAGFLRREASGCSGERASLSL